MELAIARDANSGAFGVRFDRGFVPLLFNGAPIVEDGPIWFLKSIRDLDEGLFAVEWRNAPGLVAVHFYDADLRFISNMFEHLLPHHRQRLTATVRTRAADLWAQFIGLPADPTARPAEFTAIPAALRLELADQSSPLPAREIAEFVITEACDLTPWPLLDGDFIRELLEADLDEAQRAAFHGAAFSLPSPFTGADEEATLGLFLRFNGLTAAHGYRFFDSTIRTPYVVICIDNSIKKNADWSYSIHAVFFPTMNVLVFRSGVYRQYTAGFLRDRIDRLLLREILTFDGSFDFSEQTRAAPTAVVFYTHIGHHLWNELTGLDQVVARAGGAQQEVSSVFVVGSHGTEMYGPIDRLFPILLGRVDRSLTSYALLPERLYRENRLYLHLTGQFISERLASNIMTFSEQTVAPADHREHVGLGLEGFRVVMLGLRVENRTLTDLPGFCSAVTRMLLQTLPRVAIVVDGHNRPAGDAHVTSFGSLHAPDRGALDAAEALVLDRLRHDFRDEPRVRFVSTLGRPVAASIFWASRAMFFVTPWGAGLAKYKWVCNGPGLVVSGQAFLSHPESHLYDMPDYRENARQSLRISPDEATDRPDLPALVPVGRLHLNFEVDLAAVARELRILSRADTAVLSNVLGRNHTL